MQAGHNGYSLPYAWDVLFIHLSLFTILEINAFKV